jgi:hypothetical protein
VHFPLVPPEVDAGAQIAGFLFVDAPVEEPGFPTLDWAAYERVPLLAIPLLPGENLAAHHFGHARVLALLGLQAKSRPYPWWFDGSRAPVLDYEAQAEASTLAQVLVTHAPYLQVTYSQARLELRLAEQKCATLHRVLQDEPVVALIPRLSTSATHTCVWQPDRGRQVVIWPTGDDEGGPTVHGDSDIQANFLLLGHGDYPTAAGPSEDGFILSLPDPLWTRLLASLKARESFACNVTGAQPYEVVVHVGPAEFEMYTPDPTRQPTVRRPPLRRLELDHVIFLDGAKELPEAVPMEALRALIDEAALIADDALDGVVTTCPQIGLEFRLAPGEPVHPSVAVPRDSDVPADACQVLVNRLAELPPPPVRGGELRFRLVMRFLPGLDGFA